MHGDESPECPGSPPSSEAHLEPLRPGIECPFHDDVGPMSFRGIEKLATVADDPTTSN